MKLNLGNMVKRQPPGATWNPANSDTDLVFSNGNRTVEWLSGTTTGLSGCSATVGKSAGQWFYETIIDSFPGGARVGIAPEASALTAQTLGNTGDTTGYGYLNSGLFRQNGVDLATFDSWVAGDVIAWALDLTAHLIWLRVNSGDWNADAGADPASATGGLAIGSLDYFPIFKTNAALKVTLNAGQAAAFAAVPPGFSWLA